MRLENLYIKIPDVAVARSSPDKACVIRIAEVASKEPMLPGRKVRSETIVDRLATDNITKNPISNPIERKESFMIENSINHAKSVIMSSLDVSLLFETSLNP